MRAVLLLLSLALPAKGQEAARLAAAPGIPAAVVATWSAEGGPRIEVAGFWTEGGPAASVDDPWHLGSLGKAMTATLAARLVERGAIGWDERIGDRLAAPARWRDVTLAELLTHRGGMARNLPAWRTLLRPDRAGYVEAMLAAPPAGARGAFLYSNAGYVVAGAMLEAAGGATWEELMRREVFEPLGMDGMGVGAPDPGPPGHLLGRPVPPGPMADNIPAMGPAGTLHGPADAVLRFLRAHAERDPRYLSAATWARLHRPVGGYAMGWQWDDGALRHLGTNTMWFAGMRIAADGAALVAANAGPEAAREAVTQALDAVP